MSSASRHHVRAHYSRFKPRRRVPDHRSVPNPQRYLVSSQGHFGQDIHYPGSRGVVLCCFAPPDNNSTARDTSCYASQPVSYSHDHLSAHGPPIYCEASTSGSTTSEVSTEGSVFSPRLPGVGGAGMHFGQGSSKSGARATSEETISNWDDTTFSLEDSLLLELFSSSIDPQYEAGASQSFYSSLDSSTTSSGLDGSFSLGKWGFLSF